MASRAKAIKKDMPEKGRKTLRGMRIGKEVKLSFCVADVII